MKHLKTFGQLNESDAHEQTPPDNVTVLDDMNKSYNGLTLEKVRHTILERLQAAEGADSIDQGYEWHVMADYVMRNVADGFYHPDDDPNNFSKFIEVNMEDGHIYALKQSDFDYDSESGFYLFDGDEANDKDEEAFMKDLLDKAKNADYASVIRDNTHDHDA